MCEVAQLLGGQHALDKAPAYLGVQNPVDARYLADVGSDAEREGEG